MPQLPPHTTPELICNWDAMCAAISLIGQCSVFVRNREQFAQPPFNLKIDEAFVARLTDFISELALKGMAVCTDNLNPDVVVMKSAKDRV